MMTGTKLPLVMDNDQSVNHYRATHLRSHHMHSPVQAVAPRVAHMGQLISTGNQHKPLKEDKEELPKPQ